MGCGSSRSVPVATLLMLTQRVEKEHDDVSFPPCVVKKLKVPDIDAFLDDFEAVLGDVVYLHNALFDSLTDVRAAAAAATSTCPLALEIHAGDVFSHDQLLLDVVNADGVGRPTPQQVQELSTRPDVAEADRALAAASAALARALQGPPRLSTPGQALFASAPIRLRLRPERQELALSGAPAGHPAARELARVNAALAALRKAAPGVRVRAEVVPSPAPGARTFAWQLVRPGATQLSEGSTLNPPASPLDVAWSHNAAAIAAAASALAHQAAAVAAALSVLPTTPLYVAVGGRRLVLQEPPQLQPPANGSPPSLSLPGHKGPPSTEDKQEASDNTDTRQGSADQNGPRRQAEDPGSAAPKGAAGNATKAMGSLPPIAPSKLQSQTTADSDDPWASPNNRTVAKQGSGLSTPPEPDPDAAGAPDGHDDPHSKIGPAAAAAAMALRVSANLDLAEDGGGGPPSPSRLRGAGTGARGAYASITAPSGRSPNTVVVASPAAGYSGHSLAAGFAAGGRLLSMTRREGPTIDVDEAMARLHRALAGANACVFRLTKCAMAAGRSSDGGDVTLSYALRAVLDSAVQEVRRQAGAAAAAGGGGREGAGASRAGSVGSFGDAAAAAATAVAPEGLGSGGEEDEKVDGGGVARVPAWELMQVEPRVVMGTTEAGSWGGGTTAGGGTVSGQSLPGGASMALVWNWEWEWGIVPRVPGVTFPECLPPPARKVHDCVVVLVEVARAAADQLPLLQQELAALVGEAEAVFAEHSPQLDACASDLPSAARARASLGRNANTVAASPTLLAQLQGAVVRLVEEMRRGAEEMRAAAGGPWAGRGNRGSVVLEQLAARLDSEGLGEAG